MNPLEDFPTWAFTLRTSLENESEYIYLLPDNSNLIFSILETGQLPPPIESFTDTYINDLIPFTTRKILDYFAISEEEYEVCSDFLNVIITLFCWGIDNEKLSLIHLVSDVIDETKFFYTNGQKDKDCKHFFKTLNESLMYSGALDVIKQKLNSDLPCSLCIYQLVEAFIKGLYSHFHDECQELIVSFIQSFKKYLISEINVGIRTLDHVSISSIIDGLFWVEYKFEIFPIADLFEPFFLCFKSDFIDKRILGAHFLSLFSKSHHEENVEKCVLLCKENDILTVLVDKDFQDHFLGTVFDFMIEMGKRKCFSIDNANRFWQKVVHTHISMKQQALKIMSCIVLSLSIEELSSFFSSMDKSNDYFDLIKFSIQYLSFESDGVATFLINLLLDISLDSELAQNATIEILGNNIKKSIILTILKYVFINIENGVLLPFSQRILNLSLNKLEWFSFEEKSDLHCQIICLISKNRSLGLDALSAFCKYSSHFPSIEELEAISSPKKDKEFWNLLSKLVEIQSFIEFKEIEQYLIKITKDELLKPITHQFLVFFRDLFIAINAKNKYLIKKIPPTIRTTPRHNDFQYCIRLAPLFFGDEFLLIVKQLSDQELIDEYVKSVSLTHYVYRDFLGQVAKNFIQIILGIQNDCSLKCTETTIRVLSRFIQLNESTVQCLLFGVKRHSHRKSRIINVNLCINNIVKRSCLSNDTNSNQLYRTISMLISLKMTDFYISIDNYKIAMYSDNPINNLKENCMITVHENPNIFKLDYDFYQNLPTYILHEKGYQNTLFSYLSTIQYMSIEKEIRLILEYMPTSKSILESLQNGLILNHLLNSRSFYEFKYILSILIDNLSEVEINASSASIESLRFIINNLQKAVELNESTIEIVSLIEIFIKSPSFNLVLIDFLEIVFTILLMKDVLNEVLRKIWSILCNLTKFYEKDIVDVLTNQVNVFSKILIMAKEEFNIYIHDIVEKFSNPLLLFITLIKNIDTIKMGNSDGLSFNKYVEQLVPKIQDCPEVIDSLQYLFELMNMENCHVYSSICDVFVSLLSHNKCSDFIKTTIETKFLPNILTLPDFTSRKSILKIMTPLMKSYSDMLDSLKGILMPTFLIPINQWNYSSDKGIISPGFPGLRNLGATCYMNSVLQQLFHTETFRSSLIKYVFEAEDKVELQNIFIRMLQSLMPFQDTMTFAKVWKGWMNAPINVREQQDSLEFLQILLDQLPSEISLDFQGELINITKGVDTDYYSEVSEKFFSLSFVVKDCSTFSDSMKVFLHEEILSCDNQVFSEIHQKKITISKQIRIKTCPPYLVIHLKRFEFDMKSYQRFKINSFLEFPHEIDLSNAMYQPKDTKYRLVGVVLHKGTAQGGHYTSLRLINNDWYLFDDTNVTKFDSNQFSTVCYGQNNNDQSFDSSGSAYLLIYSNIQNNFSSICSSTINYRISDIIENENQQYIIQSTILSEEMVLLMKNVKQIDFLSLYLFKVFVHTQHGHHSDDLCYLMESLINDSNYHIVEQLVVSDLDHYISTLLYCTDSKIISCIHNITRILLQYLSHQSSTVIIDRLFSILPDLFSSWRQLPNIAKVLLMYIKSYSPIPQYCIDKKWYDVIIHHIFEFYSVNRPTSILSEVDFSSLFEILSKIITISDYSLIHKFEHIQKQVLLSSFNKIAFLGLSTVSNGNIHLSIDYLLTSNSIQNYSEVQAFLDSLFHVLPLLHQDKLPTSLNAYINDKLSNYYNKNQILKSILCNLRENNNIRQMIIHYFSDIVLPFLIDIDYYNREIAELIIIELFPSTKTTFQIPSDSLIPVKAPSREYHHEIDPLFNTVFCELVNKGIPMIISILPIFYDEKPDIEHHAYLRNYIRILNWFVTTLNSSDESLYREIFSLYEACDSYQVETDYHVYSLYMVLVSFQSISNHQMFNKFLEKQYNHENYSLIEMIQFSFQRIEELVINDRNIGNIDQVEILIKNLYQQLIWNENHYRFRQMLSSFIKMCEKPYFANIAKKMIGCVPIIIIDKFFDLIAQLLSLENAEVDETFIKIVINFVYHIVESQPTTYLFNFNSLLKNCADRLSLFPNLSFIDYPPPNFCHKLKALSFYNDDSTDFFVMILAKHKSGFAKDSFDQTIIQQHYVSRYLVMLMLFMNDNDFCDSMLKLLKLSYSIDSIYGNEQLLSYLYKIIDKDPYIPCINQLIIELTTSYNPTNIHEILFRNIVSRLPMTRIYEIYGDLKGYQSFGSYRNDRFLKILEKYLKQ